MKTALLFAALSAVILTVTLSASPAQAGPPSTPVTMRNKVTLTNLFVEPVGDCSEAIPALSSVVGGNSALESTSCPAPGARPGQACLPSINLGADGGAALQATASLTCRCAQDAVFFKLTLNSNADAGILAMFDAGYRGRCVN